MNDTITKIFMLIYNLILVGGTAYLVQVYDWSMWTFLLTLLFFVSSSRSKE